MANIKKYREAAALTQLQVAKTLGISVDTLWRWENSTGEPRATELIKMAQLFGCSVDELLLGSNPI